MFCWRNNCYQGNSWGPLRSRIAGQFTTYLPHWTSARHGSANMSASSISKAPDSGRSVDEAHTGMFLIVMAAVIFCCTFKLGLPIPHNDDLFYLGAGFELSKSNHLENPLIRLQALSTVQFFAYPPLYSYIIGGWVRLFGISYNALAVFFATLVIITTIALAEIAYFGAAARVQGIRYGLLLAAVVVPVLMAFSSLGFRPEPAGFMVLALGVAVLISTDRAGLRFLAQTLIGLSLLCAPRLLFAALFCEGIPILLMIKTRKVSATELALSLAVATTVCFLLFLLMIDFQLSVFLKGIREHYSQIDYQGWSKVPLWTTITASPAKRLSLVGYILMMLGTAVHINGWAFFGRGRFAAIAAIIVLFFFWFMRQVPIYPGLALISLYSVLLVTAVGKPWAALPLLSGIVTLLCLSQYFVMLIPLAHSRKIIDPETRAHIMEKVAPPNYVAVDMYAARYICDYKLPRGAVTFENCKKFPDMRPVNLADLPPNCLLLASRPELQKMKFPINAEKFTAMRFSGRTFRTFPASFNPFVLMDRLGDVLDLEDLRSRN
jgi:hypothetical protein